MTSTKLTSRLLALSAAAALATFAACSDDPDPTADSGVLTPDGGGTGQPDAAEGPPTLTLHYHRPDKAYAGWTAVVSGDTSATTVTAAAPDGFGARFEVPLNAGATRVTFQLVNGAETQPAMPVEVDVSTVRGAWQFHGAAAPLLRAPPAIPGPNQVAIYYKRADTDYSNWGLHLWGDVVTETNWMGAARPIAIDPELGAHWLVDIKPEAARVNVIVHKGDEKDPGPDMGWDLADLGDMVFLLTGTTEIFTVPTSVPEFAISGARAHWIDRGTIAWDLGAVQAATYELRSSRSAGVTVDGAEVVGGDVVSLASVAGGLTPAQRAAWPHLATFAALTVPTSTRTGLLLQEQLVVVARDAAGKALAATTVQTPGVIDDLFTYAGPLGATFTATRTPGAITVWAPTAQAVRLVRFDANLAELATVPMTRVTSTATPAGWTGAWTVAAAPEWYGTYYQFEVTAFHYVSNRVETMRTTDPYALALSPNGRHTFLVDLDDPATKPTGWDALVKPATVQAPEDISIYELHVRDFSVEDTTVPEAHRGKFMAFTHNGIGGADTSRGMTHLRGLAASGLTVVQLLPSFDWATVEEVRAQRIELDDGFDDLCRLDSAVPAATCTQYGTRTIREILAAMDPSTGDAQALMSYVRAKDGFNWGYDPVHYTAPEGSYATDPTGLVRVREMRSAVKALAEVGLRVSLDVVYNHTNAAGTGERAVLDKLVPGYYHRRNTATGVVEQSTCCPNTATEHAMMERLMIDSLVTWTRDYKIDAFRFDLMGHHMKRNMVKALAAVQSLTPARDGVDGSSVYFYGEGWNFGEVMSNARGANATQLNMNGTGIGTFSDRLRDAARGGGPFDGADALVANQGFLNGLGYHPNTTPAPADAREKALLAADQIKVGLAGNLSRFRLVASTGRVTTGNLVNYNGSPTGYTDDPQEVITYVDKHDNQTLFDINAYKTPAGTPAADRARMQAMGISLVALGQGVPFFHAGMEVLRSKSMERDSYDSGDWWNALDYGMERTKWNVGLPREDKDGTNWPAIRAIIQDATVTPRAADIVRTRDHFQEMLAVRASSPLFRLRTAAEVMSRVDFLNGGDQQVAGLIVMTISDGTCAGADLDPARDGVVVVLNASNAQQAVDVPGASGLVLHPSLSTSTDPVVRGATAAGTTVTVPARTTAVFVMPQTGAQGSGLPCNTR